MRDMIKANRRRLQTLLSMLFLALLPACPDGLLNDIADLGGDTPGARGTVSIVFDNQTPYRAIFTVGVYDPQDQTSLPQYIQYAVDPDATANAFNRGLAAGTTTLQGDLPFTCGRVVSIGGADMISIIKGEDLTPADGSAVIDDALREGIYFSDKALNDADANGVDAPILHADPVVSLLGPDYECDALLIFHFAVDNTQADGVRVTLDVIPNEPAP